MSRNLLAAGLISLTLLGCGTPSALSNKALDTQIHANSLSDTDKVDLLSNIDELSDTFSEGGHSRSRTATGDRGGMLYRSLTSSKILRAIGYTVAYLPVKNKFGKPGVPDNLPRISDPEIQNLMQTLEPGDVVQCGNNDSFVHSLFYYGNDQIIHALAQPGGGKSMQGVCEETLSGYLSRVERDKLVVLRPHWTPEKLQAAQAYAKAQVGKDYDTLFLMDSDDRFYCTELVYQILAKSGVAKMAPHLSKQKWRLITNEDIRKSPDLEVVYRFNHE